VARMTDVAHTYWVRCSEPRVCDTFDILTFAISIVDILTFRYYDFDIVTVDIFTVDIVTCHPITVPDRRKEFPITTLTPVTISIILVWSHIDARSLIQVEKNEKAFERIQEEIMHARSTLDWSQSNNIFFISYTHILPFNSPIT